ncbi:beta-lactamase class A [Allocatelliglobosispora scoriae]|uniref:Beta-lactamase class A n=1 Tax=Allocatelliglobosispora scoriae TaxID=643052 RepID=A0A841BPP8_9ACTN|nr:serine hydrolase [Allocatelliglobosispora scoriae]MBB5869276.1 beta-lactamase class A [Allocatelliglobosispora scoriae]
MPGPLPPALHAIDLDSIDGTVSIWLGPVGGPPVFTRDAEVTHYAASTMKVAVLVALHRAAERGDLALDDEIVVDNEFVSVLPGAGPFSIDPTDDNDEQVTGRMGETATLGWLGERMIVRSSNLATNLLIGVLGTDAVNAVWRDVGARHSRTDRGIEDVRARETGVTNLVTAADLAALLSAIADGTAASPASCAAILGILEAQEYREDIPAGLPPGTRVACKNGWVPNIRHGAAVIYPVHSPAYILVVCTTTTLEESAGADLVARIAAATFPE